MTGLVPLCKDPGILSRKAGVKVSFLYGERKHGHAGTLDPLAGGVLPVLLGRATRLIPFLDEEKSYLASFSFGRKTDTGDCTGALLEQSEFRPSRAQFEAALPRFTGEILQVPPLYSALKKDGRPLYDYARKGQAVEREPRRATIHELRLEEFSPQSGKLFVRCASGTYIRTLIEDMAAACGALATMTALVRTAAYGISLEQCRTLAQMEAGDRPLLSPEELFADRLAVVAPENGLCYFENGGAIDPARFDQPPVGLCRAYAPSGQFLGLAEGREEVKLVWKNTEI